MARRLAGVLPVALLAAGCATGGDLLPGDRSPFPERCQRELDEYRTLQARGVPPQQAGHAVSRDCREQVRERNLRP